MLLNGPLKKCLFLSKRISFLISPATSIFVYAVLPRTHHFQSFKVHCANELVGIRLGSHRYLVVCIINASAVDDLLGLLHVRIHFVARFANVRELALLPRLLEAGVRHLDGVGHLQRPHERDGPCRSLFSFDLWGGGHLRWKNLDATAERRMIVRCVRAAGHDVVDDITDVTLSNIRLWWLLLLLLLGRRHRRHVLILLYVLLLLRGGQRRTPIVAICHLLGCWRHAIHRCAHWHLIRVVVDAGRRVVFPIVDASLWTAGQLSNIIGGVVVSIHIRQLISDAQSIVARAGQELSLGEEPSLGTVVGVGGKTRL